LAGGIKKWFMLQMWRVQQVAQVLTIILLALNLSLQLYGFISWRKGSFFSTPYAGVPLILLVTVAIIWGFAIVWDMRFKMWREQMAVVVERNPYAKERMTSKELVFYGITWLPVLEQLAKQNPEVKPAAEAMRNWLKQAAKEDPIATADMKEILDLIAKDPSKVLDLEK
jgi:hypothetical protein